MANIKKLVENYFDHDWIRTVNFWHRKQLIYCLNRNDKEWNLLSNFLPELTTILASYEKCVQEVKIELNHKVF